MGRNNTDERDQREQAIRPLRQRAIDKLTTETMAMLAREKVFPKRVRWQYAHSLARLVNIADSLSNVADGINPADHTEYAVRHFLNTMTVAVLSALDAKMTQAMRSMGCNVDQFDKWTALFKAARSSMFRQINRDKKKYIPMYGEPKMEGLAQVLNILISIIGTCSI